MKRLLVSLTATLLLIGIVVGVPWLLLWWGRLVDLPSSLRVQNWLRPDDGTLTTGLLTVLGWAAWAVFAWSTLTEALRQVSRNRIRLRLPGTSWLSPVVSALVAAALAPLMSAHAAVPEPAAAAVVATPATPPTDATPTEDSAGVPVAAEEYASPGRWRRYTVTPGDELWDIAVRELGGGERWREIVAANPGLDPEAELVPHTVLLLPATVTVERGDTLWDLAEEHLGDPEEWPQLHAANRDLIADPDEIDVGWVLALPGTGAPAPPEQPRIEAPAEPSSPVPAPSPEDTSQAPGTISPVEVEPSEATTPRHGDASPSPPTTASALRVIGPVGALLGAGLVVALASRRRLSLAQREVGRRIPTPVAELSKHWAALGLLATDRPEQPPEGMAPTSVLLGWGPDQEELWCELETAPLWVAGPAEEVQSLSAALLTSLLCAEWSHDVEVVTVAAEEAWAAAIDDPRLSDAGDTEAGLERLDQLVTNRMTALGDEALATVRQDPDRAPGFTPTVFLFCSPLTSSECSRITALLGRGRSGVSVVAAHEGEQDMGHLVRLFSSTRAEATPGGEFAPQLLRAPARRALVGLFEATNDPGTQPAPWWSPHNITPLPSSPISEELRMPPEPSSPTLLLLGEAKLVACDGQPPTRSTGRCLEACAWLLSHPGCTPTQMREGLMIAEGTRRSVVSRLRGWLGSTARGEHLPDAYSGRIELAATVSSDWERFQSLLAGGVNHASEAALTEALALVRGAPLAGYEFQWGWAESLRCDMVSMIVDAAVVLAERCLARRDLAAAEWALGQGALAGPDSEALTARRILLRATQGDRTAVDQEVLQLTRTARAEGRDLTETTVRIIQKALSQCLSTTR